ncbi:MAG: protein kinase [Actinomycetota bacterium]|nr:protein kinase [Actinomycetota bacterium]
MPPPLPDRYQLQVRLDRDQDVEEWLATDLVLDRPVLVRLLGPESSPDRRQQFLRAARAAAGVTHSHLCAIYAASELDEGAYMVGEWAGGVTLAHRLQAGETVPLEEFLPNASGLADAVAALHSGGFLHGSVDPATIFYTHAHPARLGAFGRPPRYSDAGQEVAALAATLEASLTGRQAGAPPSQMADGLPAAVDHALDEAREGLLDASGLASALRAVPSPAERSSPSRPGWSWRWLVPASLLLGLAVAITSLGLILRAPPQSDLSNFLFPASPDPIEAPPTTPTSSTSIDPAGVAGADGEGVAITEALAYDPFGDGTEHDSRVGEAFDDDPDTSWRTERYFDPLPRLKEGVGIAFQVDGVPSGAELLVTPGTSYLLLWSNQVPTDFSGWERLAAGTTGGGTTRLQLPRRESGLWLLWFKDLPAQEDGYSTDVSEVTFLP